MKSFSFPCKTP